MLGDVSYDEATLNPRVNKVYTHSLALKDVTFIWKNVTVCCFLSLSPLYIFFNYSIFYVLYA